MVRFSNFELLEALRANSRIPYVALADMFGVSETAVRKRIRKLEEQGVIRGYTIDTDYRKIGLGVHALIGIDSTPQHYISLIDALKKLPDAHSLFTSTGDHMLMLECRLEDSASLSRLVKSIQRMRGVTKVCPAIILERLK